MESKHEGIHELLYQALETELGGEQIYEAALHCAVDSDLRKEWGKYLQQTRQHQEVLRAIFNALQIDPDKSTPGRHAVWAIGQTLVEVIQSTQKKADPAVAQIVAAECVVLAETKDHLNWELIGYAADQLPGDLAKMLKDAYASVEAEEDHHLYHTRGWAREMWIESMGFKAVLPPPEEVKNVESAAQAARAEQARGKMM